MRTARPFVILLVLMSSTVAFCQNLLPNGDFESGFTSWTQAGTVALSGTVVQGGAQALMASDTLRAAYAYAYQEVALDFEQHDVTFWVYPASEQFFSAFEFLTGWQSAEPLQFISRVLLRDSTMSFTVIGANESVDNPLRQDAWNKITIRFDSATLQQSFLVNDTLLSTLTASAFPTTEHLLVGDLSITGMYGTVYFDQISVVARTTTDVIPRNGPVAGFHVEANYPNPFNPSTTIRYSIAHPAYVTFGIYTLAGERIRTLEASQKPAGIHIAVWDGLDDGGAPAASGVYLYRLAGNGQSIVRKMTLLK